MRCHPAYGLEHGRSLRFATPRATPRPNITGPHLRLPLRPRAVELAGLGQARCCARLRLLHTAAAVAHGCALLSPLRQVAAGSLDIRFIRRTQDMSQPHPASVWRKTTACSVCMIAACPKL